MTISDISPHTNVQLQQPASYTLSIAATATRGACSIGNRAPIRLLIPSTWATTAAIVHVETSEDGTTYYPLWDSANNTAYTVVTNTGKASIVDPTKFHGVAYIRLIGTQARGTAFAQATAVTVSVVAMKI